MAGRITAYWIKTPLKHTYNLAMGNLDEFDSIVVVIDDRKRCSWGEATALPVYSWEGAPSIWQTVKDCVEKSGGDLSALKRYADISISKSPFAASSILAAIEKNNNLVDTGKFGNIEIPLAGIVNADRDKEIENKVEELIKDGYKTLKVKLLGSPANDIEKIKRIQNVAGPDIKIRLDANESYVLEKVKRLLDGINLNNLELLEQPFKRGDWQAARSFTKWNPVPLMLDESIWRDSDIEKAVTAGALFIKLKLVKHGGIVNTIRMARKAKESGLEVILGNGVQTDLGCIDECYIYKAAGLKRAGEMNGFLKVKHTFLDDGIRFKKGIAALDLGKAFEEAKNLRIEEKNIFKKYTAKMKGAAYAYSKDPWSNRNS